MYSWIIFIFNELCFLYLEKKSYFLCMLSCQRAAKSSNLSDLSLITRQQLEVVKVCKLLIFHLAKMFLSKEVCDIKKKVDISLMLITQQIVFAKNKLICY